MGGLGGTDKKHCPSHCLSGAKLRQKTAVWNGAAIDNNCHSRQHASTDFENHCFTEKCLFLCSGFR